MTQYLSQDKHDALAVELDELRTKKMPETAKRIDEARQMGDLSENAEYHAAREQLGWEKGREKEIRAILDSAEILDEKIASSSVVNVGSTIVVQLNGHERTYNIVGAQEADPASGKISNESPLGEALLGSRVGDTVPVEVPAGIQTYTIIQVG
ncbi:MAG: transcription elongation factor GreA [Candidatus Magasanikbacteria bacterium CG10_big_fil_rev_8_21_14_0_10_47_10]|uniref:Transcription elongation factor GreA n=1 Tax=Candidatus Magasanikbacteria bacterium CG10_big_fil_rev_8_21_14_0_10_47_10 TaxID=1974652 RepID=A0A2H0TQN7_9BACT|nr:MAG: transcription elongation factor GreA [Candidatus Magasanikbacteria bacterium CG10_big_fil_rev_8_21_14_0_10_47_10]